MTLDDAAANMKVHSSTIYRLVTRKTCRSYGSARSSGSARRILKSGSRKKNSLSLKNREHCHPEPEASATIVAPRLSRRLHRADRSKPRPHDLTLRRCWQPADQQLILSHSHTCEASARLGTSAGSVSRVLARSPGLIFDMKCQSFRR